MSIWNESLRIGFALTSLLLVALLTSPNFEETSTAQAVKSERKLASSDKSEKQNSKLKDSKKNRRSDRG
jgi:hypothetical protein